VLGATAQDWTRVRRAREEFDKEYEHIPDMEDKDFISWLVWTYGIQLTMTLDQRIENNFEIVDAQKYTVFLLKYS
jgi:hypothetical protein